MAGVATALPQDTMVSATNPAGMAYIGNSLDVAIAAFSPSPRGYEANADFATNPQGFPTGSLRNAGRIRQRRRLVRHPELWLQPRAR